MENKIEDLTKALSLFRGLLTDLQKAENLVESQTKALIDPVLEIGVWDEARQMLLAFNLQSSAPKVFMNLNTYIDQNHNVFKGMWPSICKLIVSANQ